MNKNQLIEKIRHLDHEAAEKIAAIQEQLKKDVIALGYEDAILGSYDCSFPAYVPKGTSRSVNTKYEEGECIEGEDYIYSNALS